MDQIEDVGIDNILQRLEIRIQDVKTDEELLN